MNQTKGFINVSWDIHLCSDECFLGKSNHTFWVEWSNGRGMEAESFFKGL